MPPLTIATFNINGINRRLANLLEWLEREEPDVVCLQELKATDQQFPARELHDAGYHAIWRGEPRWNGVAILARGAQPIETRRALPGQDDPKSWLRDALLQPESRECYSRLLAQGWVDSLREKHPRERVYTFWDYFRDHWKRDAGLRIDHLLLNAELALRLLAAGVDRWVRDRPHASDHAPTWIKLRAATAATAVTATQATTQATRAPRAAPPRRKS